MPSDGSAVAVSSPKPFDLSKGKVSILIYPSRTDRKKISLRLADDQNVKSPHTLETHIKPGKIWQTIEVPIPEAWLEAYANADKAKGDAALADVFNPQKSGKLP